MNVLLISAILLGVAGSAHCLVMCGPIALAVPSRSTSLSARSSSTLLLNGGRLFTYAVLGSLFGTFGYGIHLAGAQQFVSIMAGSLLLLSILLPRLFVRWNPGGHVALGIGRMRSVLAKNLRRTAPGALFLTGSLNGLLPCGLLYSALLGAAAMGTWHSGAGFMMLFGLGTWPAMIALRMSGAAIGEKLRIPLRKLAPAIVCGMALLLILRGLELDIPMLSPLIGQVPHAVTGCH